MPRNGSGVCSPSISFVADQAASTPPQASRFDSVNQDLADEITNSIACDGQSTVTANIPMSGFKFTGLGAGSAASDGAIISDLRTNLAGFATPSGTTTLTATLSPAIASYTSGLHIWCIMPAACGGATTINLNGLGAKNVLRYGGAACAVNDWAAGEFVLLFYDGTQFLLASRAAHVDVPREAALLSVSESAPVGYSQHTGFDDKVFMATALSGIGGTSGGSWTISGISNESANHTHTYSGTTSAKNGGSSQGTSSSAGASTPLDDHTHTFSGTTSTESANHSHTFNGTWRPACYFTIVIVRQ